MKMKSILVLATLVLFFGSAPSTSATIASFQGLGFDLPGGTFDTSYARGVSTDGSVVVGFLTSHSGSRDEAFRWQDGVMTGLDDLSGGNSYSQAYAVSADGSTVVGISGSGSGDEAFRWQDGVMTGLGDLPGDSLYSRAWGVSGDGSVVVGNSSSSNEAFRWQNGVMTGLGYLPASLFHSEYSGARGVSANGLVVVGNSTTSVDYYHVEAFRWEDGVMTGLGNLGDPFSSWAYGVSADGSVVVGYSGSEAFRWQDGVMTGLGDLPGGTFTSSAYAVSADGSVVVGRSASTSGPEAFIWDGDNGIRSLKDILIGYFGLDLNSWELTNAMGISADGLTIVGYGINPDGNTEGWIVTIPEPCTPPVADGDGPYSIYVGDSLVLDGSGSTDDDNDIVSYVWDLDDDENFETDAGGQAIFEVSYAYLQSLGLIVDHTYNIHVQVTDSEGQSDVADSTLIIVPMPATVVAVDIRPGSCPNPVNVKSSGVLPIAILGTADLDVSRIDATSVRLAGVEALRSCLEDVAGPLAEPNECDCTTDGADGFTDLTLKFETQKIVETLGEVDHGDVRELRLTGVLLDAMGFESPIEGADCIVIRGRHRAINKADINKNGVVDLADLTLLIENWLESSVVEK